METLAGVVLFPGWQSLRLQGRWEGLLQDKNCHWGHVGLEGTSIGVAGPANICPSALCQNMLEMHLGPCPRVAAPSGLCAYLHDNSKNCVNCCALSQMLPCTCGLIRWHSPPPRRVQKFCIVSVSKMCHWYNGSQEESCGQTLNNYTCCKARLQYVWALGLRECRANSLWLFNHGLSKICGGSVERKNLGFCAS